VLLHSGAAAAAAAAAHDLDLNTSIEDGDLEKSISGINRPESQKSSHRTPSGKASANPGIVFKGYYDRVFMPCLVLHSTSTHRTVLDEILGPNGKYRYFSAGEPVVSAAHSKYLDNAPMAELLAKRDESARNLDIFRHATIPATPKDVLDVFAEQA
jgi:hypothetical protein